ncbi:MAG: methyltransferase family protein [Methanococcaceae archaeon]
MKITGAAPQIAIPTFLYMFLTIYIHYRTRPAFEITQNHKETLIIIAIVLIIIGATMVAAVGRKLLKSFKEGKLMTDGLFSIFRNPMYTAYLLFVIPGICLFFNSWIVLSTVIINFILYQMFIREEYRYLEKKFGKEYQDYLKKVWFKFL